MVLAGLGLVALAAWVAIVRQLDFRAIDDTGLISVIPPAAYACIALLAVSFVLALRTRPLLTPVLSLLTAALIVMLYGAPAFFEEMPRFVTGWLHVGFSDAIAETGELYPLRDARFDWPGFFILGAFLGSAANLDSMLGILQFIPPAQMLLYLGPLYLIVRSGTSDGRLVWLSLWFFCLMNWVGQDYYSPQGFNVLLYLTVLGILLTSFRRPPGTMAWYHRLRALLPRRRARPAESTQTVAGASTRAAAIVPMISNREHIGLVAVVALLFGASVASHQLTPFALLGGVALLIILGRVQLTGLPLLMFVLLVSWLMFRASTYLAGHLAGLLEDLGRPDQFATSNIAARLDGSPGHLLVIQARLGFTLGIWLLGLIGGLRAIRARRLDVSLAALAVAPFGLMLLQGYGGEMVLRIFLFSVPFMAFHAANAFLPTPRSQSWPVSIALIVVSVVLAGGLLLSRYGNEKADLVTMADYEAIRYAIAIAEPGDIIATPNAGSPVGHAEWEQHSIVGLGAWFEEGDIDGLVQELEGRARPGRDIYFVITRGQRAAAEVFWGLTNAEWEERVAEVRRNLDLLYENADASVFRFRASVDEGP